PTVEAPAFHFPEKAQRRKGATSKRHAARRIRLQRRQPCRPTLIGARHQLRIRLGGLARILEIGAWHRLAGAVSPNGAGLARAAKFGV
ncbi:MAG: hypothetical protein ABWX67_08260, partial [Allosphingosinicella sp.]